VKLLRKHGNGALELQRVDSREDVFSFLQAAGQIFRVSWQHAYVDEPIEDNAAWRDELTDLADRGLLRSYLLRCGGQPCAFAFGYHFGGVHHADQTAYDPALHKFSPGSVLHTLFIEDLIRNTHSRRLSFGFGHADYKQSFGNVHSEQATVLLVRRGIRNRLRCACHGLFRHIVARVKRHRIQSSDHGDA
jgi:CelD/BcsL family acetyltransferase involved in cellulose biosynthesis